MTETPAADRAPPPPKRRSRRLWLGLILAIAVFAAGVALAPRIIGALPPWLTESAAPRPVATLAPAPDASPPPASSPSVPPAADTDALQRRIAALEAEVARLRTDATGGVPPETVAALGGQLGQLSLQLAEQQGRLKALEDASPRALVTPIAILGLSRLRQSVEQGAPYAGALASLERLPDGAALPDAATDALATLKAHEARGVASLLALRDGFSARIGDIIDAEAAPPGAGWWDRTLARLEGLVTVRPTGEAKGADAPAIAARAEAALGRGDLAGAMREVEGLSPAAAAQAADWLRQARERRAVLAALDTLEAALLEGVAAGGTGVMP